MLVLHVGQAKAASTSVQVALSAARPTLAEHGIFYPDTGRPDHHAEAAWFRLTHGAANTRALPKVEANTRRIATNADWDSLVATVRESKLTIISSEYFASFGPALAAAAIDSLSSGHKYPTRVVVIARPVSRLLPSLYCQSAIDFALPSFEMWARMQLLSLTAAVNQGSLKPGPLDSGWLASVWSRVSPVRVVDFDPPTGATLDGNIVDALQLTDVLTPPVLGHANRAYCAARIVAWQRCLTRAGRPDHPGHFGAPIPFRAFQDDILPGRGGRFGLTAHAAELIDAAIPRPSPDTLPSHPELRAEVWSLLGQLITSKTPITEVVGVDPEGLSEGVNICLQHLPFESVRA